MTDKHTGAALVSERQGKADVHSSSMLAAKTGAALGLGASPAFEGLGEDDLVEGPREERRTVSGSSGSC